MSEDFQGQSRGVIKINQHRKLCQYITSICSYQLPQEMQCLRQEYKFLCWLDKVGRHTCQYSAGNLSENSETRERNKRDTDRARSELYPATHTFSGSFILGTLNNQSLLELIKNL